MIDGATPCFPVKKLTGFAKDWVRRPPQDPLVTMHFGMPLRRLLDGEIEIFCQTSDVALADSYALINRAAVCWAFRTIKVDFRLLVCDLLYHMFLAIILRSWLSRLNCDALWLSAPLRTLVL
jgi:hypothetical protein